LITADADLEIGDGVSCVVEIGEVKDEGIRAQATGEEVSPEPAADGVVAVTASDGVYAGSAKERVMTCTTCDGVIVGAAVEIVIG